MVGKRVDVTIIAYSPALSYPRYLLILTLGVLSQYSAVTSLCVCVCVCVCARACVRACVRVRV